MLFDQPHVVTGASTILEAAGVAGRCTVIGGDFFQSVPGGADAYVFKNVLHDWEDDECVRILGAVRRAREQATVLIVEWVVGPPNEDADAKLSDLNMLVMPGGRERTLDEWDRLLDAASFQRVGVSLSRSGRSIMEARAIPPAELGLL